MRLYDVLNLGWIGNSASMGAELVHTPYRRYRSVSGSNPETDEIRFLLGDEKLYGAFKWPVQTVVKVTTGQHDGKLGVVVGYEHGPTCGWWVKVKLADCTTTFRHDAIEDAKIPSDLIEIAIGCRDQIKDKVHAKVEEAFA